MPCSFVLVLALAAAPPRALELSPEAAAHNTEAMRFYDAGQLASAVDEFYAAYEAMPDARHALAGRALLLDSMHMTLHQLYDQTRDPAALCRLRDVLQQHIDGLMTAFPDDPDRDDIRSVRSSHTRVSQQLSAYRPGVCEPTAPVPPPSASPPAGPAPASPPAASPSPTPSTAPTSPSARSVPAPADHNSPDRAAAGRPSRIAGGVLLPLGLVAIGVVGGIAVKYRRDLDAADALHAALLQRPCTDDDRARMRDLLTATRREEALMISLGIVGGALITTGAALLVRGALQRRHTRLGLDLRPGRALLSITGEF